MEAFNIAYDDVYGQPPLSGAVHLDAAYVARAEKDVALQLSRAGVRLAAVLNKALAGRWPTSRRGRPQRHTRLRGHGVRTQGVRFLATRKPVARPPEGPFCGWRRGGTSD
jgi:hypothetical protein